MSSDFPYLLVRDVQPNRLWRRLETGGSRGVTVVVTVYNGRSVLPPCFDALLQHTPRTVRILAIDDGSTDEETVQILDRYATDTRIEVLRHPTNRGYTRTANHGLDVSSPDDVVLLNSDTVVGPMWLQRLRWTCYYEDCIGTVSAVSNDAAANSVPRRHQNNVWYPRLGWDTTARLLSAGAAVWSQDVPSAHGFCMYIRREALKQVGPFDSEAFPIGYGEEVDFSIRARRAGWRNAVAPHVFVKHQRSASFGDRRADLNTRSKSVLAARYPSFRHEVALWESSVGAALVEVSSARIRTAWKGSELGPLVAELGPDPSGDVLLTRSGGAVAPFGHRRKAREWVPGDGTSGAESDLAGLAVTRGVEVVRSASPALRRVGAVLGLDAED